MPHRADRRLLRALLAVVPLLAGLAACSLGSPVDKTLTLATVFPTSGPDGALGLALQHAVDLAAKQQSKLGNGFTLSVTHIDEAGVDVAAAANTLAADKHVMAVVGPLDSQSAADLLPVVAQNGIATISPGATLPGLTKADLAAAEGLAFADLHPQGKPVAFFRLPATDDVAGRVAAGLAVAPAQSHGLAAQSVYIVDDGTAQGKALAAAFATSLKAKKGTVAGQRTLAAGTPDSAQATVTAIVRANPDLVFYAGGTAGGVELRRTLSLSGALGVTILTAGPVADHPAWSASMGVAAAAANTVALAPAPDLSTLPGTQDFATTFHTAYPDDAQPPQTALAYDAAMDAITAIKALVASGKDVTRAAVLSVVATASYQGVTGTVAFDKLGDNTASPVYSLYTCDTQAAWHYQATIKG